VRTKNVKVKEAHKKIKKIKINRIYKSKNHKKIDYLMNNNMKKNNTSNNNNNKKQRRRRKKENL